MKTAAFVLIALASGITAGRAADAVPDRLLACGKIADVAERAHCYDDTVAAMKAPVVTPAPSATAPAPVATAPAPSAAAPVPVASATPPTVAVPPSLPAPLPAPVAPVAAQSSQAQKFGQEQLPQAQRARPAPQDEVLLSSISAIRTAGPKTWLITLANGQVWRQEGTQVTGFFVPGDEVHIEKGLLGDYRLSSERIGSKNWIRVTRVK